MHGLAPHASCRACVDACPAQAWLLDDEGLSLDTSRCDGCALCVPACPRDAIALAPKLTVLHDHGGRGTAFAACDRVSVRGVPSIPCLHALGVRDLDRLAGQNILSLKTLCGACATCPRGGKRPGISAAVAAHTTVRQSRGEPSVTVEPLTAAAFQRAHARALEDSERVDQGRRRLFGGLLGPAIRATAQPTAPRSYIGPVLDPARCTACDACIRICPDGALSQSADPPAYEIGPEQCTGCGLCVDVCDQRAITLRTLPLSAKLAVNLAPHRCKACYAPYYEIEGHGKATAGKETAGLCRICARTNHHRNLFQVFKD